MCLSSSKMRCQFGAGVVALLTAGLIAAVGLSISKAQPLASSGSLYVLDIDPSADASKVLVVDPVRGESTASYNAGTDADMAVSPDGTRLYVTSSYWNDQLQENESFLEVYDTGSHAQIAKIPNQDPVQSTAPIHPSRMAVSPSGKWLYMMKVRNPQSAMDIYVAAFDTEHNSFLPGRVVVNGCKASVLLPKSEDRQVDVLCKSGKYVHEITFGMTADTTVDNRHPIELPGTGLAKWQVALLRPSDGSVAMIGADGTTLALSSSGSTELFSKTSMLQSTSLSRALVSPGNPANAYFGTAQEPLSVFEQFNQIVDVDTETMAVKNSHTTVLPFYAMSLSNDGGTIYTVSPIHSKVTAIEVGSLRELRQLSIGKTPILVIAAP